MRKLRIAQVTNLQESVPPLNKNGLEQVVSYITEELVKMGHEVTLFSTADSKTSAKLIPVWPVAVSRDPFGKLLHPETYALWAVSKAFASHDMFDIIHDHSRFIAPYFAELLKVPVVSTVHHPLSFERSFESKYPPDYQQYFKDGWDQVEQKVTTVVVSKFQKSHYPTNSTVIYNGIPLNQFKFENKSENYLAFLGYISPDKGASQAVQAAIKSGERLLVAGPIREDDPRSKGYFDKEIKPFLGSKIEYVGPLNYQEKLNFLRKAKATLMPIQWDEPFGMVAIESMACGTPVIANNRAAMPEIIENGISGYLVNSIEEMAQKIAQIDKLDRQKVRAHVEQNFTSQKMAENYVRLYDKILSQ